MADNPRPWQQVDSPVETRTDRVELQRPSESKFATDRPEPAETIVIKWNQIRRRVVDEDGITIVQKQEVVYTETTTTWSPTEDKVVKEEQTLVQQ